MTDFSFDIKCSADFFRKLKEDFNDYQEDTTSSRKAINCAMTAWHLSDWIYNEFINIPSNSFSKLEGFQADLKRLCPSLQIMHDITNGSKHHTLTRHKTQIDNTHLHIGPFSKVFSREFDQTSLDIEMKDGSRKYFEDEIVEVVKFWNDYLVGRLNIEI